MHNTLYTFSALLSGGRKITLVCLRLTIIETIWLQESALLEEIIKPIQGFIIHMYQTSYVVQEDEVPSARAPGSLLSLFLQDILWRSGYPQLMESAAGQQRL